MRGGRERALSRVPPAVHETLEGQAPGSSRTGRMHRRTPTSVLPVLGNDPRRARRME
jgi:hypothetical protein